ncbi:FIST signal transduction protein [Dyadobacter sp. CY312]|uniref:FIST signal transduction protein n=1 Tax=Dyadobacter sp. CY312 TaxID=2907303 RepID=UPI001F2D1019|nr:FIST N-terminal domain-containing protein [Dyadobacter sp. CY312]MCE7041055.1 FIST C-terminal domain-containing protein [Dyadobacter sp. CY312]
MITQQLVYSGERPVIPFSIDPDLIVVFGCRTLLERSTFAAQLRIIYPKAIFSGCSTAGEIAGETVADGTVVVTGIQFKNTPLSSATIALSDADFNSYEAGKKLVSQLPKAGLKHVFVISDGIRVNGTYLVKGMREALTPDVAITGGMAGDGSTYSKTILLEPDGNLASEKVAAIGFYGDSISVGFGSRGGWNSFGLERIATKSEGNVLYEIDGLPALDLYKSFLGEHTKALPISGLLFPFSMRKNKESDPVARTILGISEKEKSISFAGDIPQGSFIRLMRANNDRLIAGAGEAASVCIDDTGKMPEFAILISCIGRKLVLKQIVEEEVENVSEVLHTPTMTGFYSYGELAPFNKNTFCELHNQTMTITTFREN